MRNIVIALGFFTGGSLLGQAGARVPASMQRQRAYVLMAQGRSAEASTAFQQAIELDPWQHPFTYFEAVSAALAARDTAVANTMLSKGIQHGFDPGVITGDEAFQNFFSSPASAPARSSMVADKAAWAEIADSLFIKDLDSLVVEDQRYRKGSDMDVPMMRRVDSLNFEHLLRYCEGNGFPDQRTLGHSSGDLHLLLWHHRGAEYPNSSQWRRMIPHIRKAMLDGLVSVDYLAMFDDFSDHEAGRPMRYGVLIGYFANYPEMLHFVDRASLNANRASIALGPIEDAAIVAGVDLRTVQFEP